MGIFGALTTAVTGMRAQAYALENISGNIANSQTTAFKRIDTSFMDLIPDTVVSQQLAGNVLANSRSTNTVQGDIQSASVSTFMAINGEGFFVVEKPDSFADGTPTFNGSNLYSRRGDFQLDQNGYLVNGAGYYLMGIPIDPTTGNLTGNSPQTLQFQNNFLPAVATTEIDYKANLASYPQTVNADPTTPGSELINSADFTPASIATVAASDNTTFLNETISGGAVTGFDTNRRGGERATALGQDRRGFARRRPCRHLEFVLSDQFERHRHAVPWLNAGTDYTFGANGQLSPAITSVTLTGVTVDGASLGNIQLVHGSGGITQYADASGSVQVNQLQQNGFPAGQLQSIAVNDKGRIVGTYSNGRTLDLAEITLANFNGANMLKRIDGGAFEATDRIRAGDVQRRPARSSAPRSKAPTPISPTSSPS